MQIQSRIDIPVIHIAEETASELKHHNITTIALLGTTYTMTQDFHKEKLGSARIEVLIQDEQNIKIINNVIFNELCLGIISETSIEQFCCIIESLAKQGAQRVILGCMAIGMLINQNDIDLSVIDTIQIHALKAASLSMEE